MVGKTNFFAFLSLW